MFLLDTNVLSELMKAQVNSHVLSWLDQQLESDLFYCVVSKAEIEWGIAKLPAGKRKQQLLDSSRILFELFNERCLAYECNAASVYVEIAQAAKAAGRPMSTEDMLIAAIAQANNATLVTRNIMDFESIQFIRVFNPWQI